MSEDAMTDWAEVRRYGRFEKITVPCDTGSETKVWQSSKDECDVNLIMRNYAASGVIQHKNEKIPMYGDFTSTMTLAEAFDQTKRANAAFMALPPELRLLVNNDPARLLEVVDNPEWRDRIQKMGIPIFEKAPESPAPKEPAKPAEETKPE